MDPTQAIRNAGQIESEGHVFMGSTTIGPNSNLCTYMFTHSCPHRAFLQGTTDYPIFLAITKIINKPAPPPATVFDVPETRNDRFVGREDVLEMLESLLGN